MFSDDEKRFMTWWELNRDKEKRTVKQWLVGLPLGLLFGIPILINFFSDWYRRASMIVNAQVATRNSGPVVMIIGVLLIISFIAIFSKQHKWEMNDQRYRELKAREKLTQE
jgi:quinol-cytochrome oxidoreductase complex cytochrome b subunit